MITPSRWPSSSGLKASAASASCISWRCGRAGATGSASPIAMLSNARSRRPLPRSVRRERFGSAYLTVIFNGAATALLTRSPVSIWQFSAARPWSANQAASGRRWPARCARSALAVIGRSLKRSRLHFAAGVRPVLEAAEIVDVLVAHVLEQLAAQGGAAAGAAIEDHILVLGKILVVRGRVGVGAKFQKTARDVERARDLATLFHFRRFAHVDDERIALRD